jgi:hypothetical protein
MTAARNPSTAATEALIEAHAAELKLPTVRRRFREFAADAVREQQTPIAYLAALLDAAHQERAQRRERRRLNDPRFPMLKRLEDFRFADNASVPQATIAALAEGSWIDDRESVIFVGDSGPVSHCPPRQSEASVASALARGAGCLRRDAERRRTRTPCSSPRGGSSPRNLLQLATGSRRLASGIEHEAAEWPCADRLFVETGSLRSTPTCASSGRKAPRVHGAFRVGRS